MGRPRGGINSRRRRHSTHPWRKECPTRKITYHNQQEAELSRMAAERRGRPLNVYQCSLCGHWHLTSQEQRSHK